MSILVTGGAGFIGYHLINAILKKKLKVCGIDSMNHYYDVGLKESRLRNLKQNKEAKNLSFYKFDINNFKMLDKVIKKHNIKIIINLAAQAGVRYSLKKPEEYIKSNINGFFNILQAAKINNISLLLHASSSSVYGNIKKYPFNENFKTSTPLQIYAATKSSNELMAHSYSNLFKIPIICMRFFTVYGPWGRPDMALFSFTKNILKKKTIDIYNYGKHQRDFTYIEDIIKYIVALIKYKKKLKQKKIPFDIFNLGNGKPEKLMNYIKEIEKNLNIKSKKNFLCMQKGDIHKTCADTSKIDKLIKIKKTNVKVGVKKFIHWYKNFYKIK